MAAALSEVTPRLHHVGVVDEMRGLFTSRQQATRLGRIAMFPRDAARRQHIATQRLSAGGTPAARARLGADAPSSPVAPRCLRSKPQLNRGDLTTRGAS